MGQKEPIALKRQELEHIGTKNFAMLLPLAGKMGNIYLLLLLNATSLSMNVCTKFFVDCEPGTQQMEGLLKAIYELYTDYVLKNSFYDMEMPIRCELFDINPTQAVQKDRVALLGR
ncbi:hypothetical protein CIPAW_07G032000 [Carya illinoinensis]|uniref:Trafficking protein particle complex subunit n=1 Tax=Carya illinoinensis TaxID=32201 RepID=A0A8T1PZ91_CARIL|nr:hypothetical protein CIPAW_07G032000 [Carya illinoinensis]